MPYEIETTATSRAAPDVIFRHLCVAEAWGEWGGRRTRGRRVSAGDEHPNGIGAVRRMRYRRREEVVAWDPPKHYGYIALTGSPRRRLRADVTLEPHIEGTLVRWRGTFDAPPGTGPLMRALVRRRLGAYARRLAQHSERCEPGCPARLPGAF
ncbi:MAG TPA: SRPBCC family protein [Spirillospora sp.]